MCAPQMSQRVPWQIGFTTQCPHYCYQGNQAPLHNPPILSSFSEGGEKGGIGLDGAESRVGTRHVFQPSSSLTLTHIRLWELAKASWPREGHAKNLQSMCLSSLHTHICVSWLATMTSMTFLSFLICLLYLKAVWAWGRYAVALP